jgi:hypothetical protein
MSEIENRKADALAGVPLVVRDLPVLREVFRSAARFAADPAALDHALTAEEPARRAAGRRLVARHTWAAAAARHVEFYRSLS